MPDPSWALSQVHSQAETRVDDDAMRRVARMEREERRCILLFLVLLWLSLVWGLYIGWEDVGCSVGVRAENNKDTL